MLRRGTRVPIWGPAAIAVAAILVVVAATPVSAQLERDRPVPPGEPAPATVFTRLAGAGTAADHPHADHVIVLDQTVSEVMENGVTYVDLYTITKVLTEEGARALSALEWHYDPQSSFVEVSDVNVVRDGKRIPVDVSLVEDLPAPQRAIYWSDRIKVLQLPRLRPGDGIEVTAMRKGYNYALLDRGPEPVNVTGAREHIASPDDDRYIPPMAGHYFDIVVMQADVPIVEKLYTLKLPADKRLLSEEYNGAIYTRTRYNEKTTEYSWWVKDVPALPHEARQPGEQDISPKVVMTTAADWEAKSKWFFDVNKNQFEVTDDIREHVEKVLADAGLTTKSDPMKIAAALNHWVAQNIRYSGQTMGEGEGFTLHPSDMLFEYRSGVCKDIASMSITLLRAAGLHVYPAMTMAGSRIEDIPADQFNHCVVAWEKEPGEFVMLDPTWVPFNNDIWSKLETEQQYLIGHPEGEDLNEIRYSPPEESPMTLVNEAVLGADGTLTGTVRIDGRGACDSRLRRIVYHSQKRLLAQSLAQIFSAMSDRVRITSVDHRRVDDFTGDMWLTFSYEVPGYAMAVGDGLEFKPPVTSAVKDYVYFFRAGATDWPEDRKTDVFLYYTQRLDVTESIRVPNGYRLVDETEPEPVDETYAAFDGKVDQAGRTLTLHTRTDIRRRQIPPSGYAGLRKAVAALDEFADRPVRIEKGGAR